MPARCDPYLFASQIRANHSLQLTSCFHAPFSASHVVDEKIFGPKIDKLAPTVEEGEEKRNIIFLGHDVDNDISYLRKVGFDPLNRGNLLETMDTRSMYQAYTHGRSLLFPPTRHS